MKPKILIPAYEPDARLTRLVRQLIASGFSIVVVDDGSRRGSHPIFQELQQLEGCEVVSHSHNIGKGAAIKTGIAFLLKNYPEGGGIITADADGQHAAEDILRMAALLEQRQDQIILGTRNFKAKAVPFRSRLGNHFSSFVFLVSTHHKCSDTQTGLRGIPQTLLEKSLSIRGERYEYEMNFLLEMISEGVRCLEMPIRTIYVEGNRSSHFRALWDSLRISYVLFQFSLSSMLCAIADLSLFTILANFVFGVTTYGLLGATVIARIFSGNLNYFLNKHWVFQSTRHSGKEFLLYLTLFLSQMFCSWLLISGLRHLGQDLTLTKMIVDTALFLISYLIQKNLIFAEKGKGRRLINESVF